MQALPRLRLLPGPRGRITRPVCHPRAVSTLGLPCVGVGKIIDAAGEFFHHLADVHWLPLAIALGFHLARLLARVPAWRNILRASYPDLVIPRRTVPAPTSRASASTRSSPPAAATSSSSTSSSTASRERPTPRSARRLIVETLFDMVGRRRDPRLGAVDRRPPGPRRAPAPAAGRLELAATPQEGVGR